MAGGMNVQTGDSVYANQLGPVLFGEDKRILLPLPIFMSCAWRPNVRNRVGAMPSSRWKASHKP